jgi:anthranilate 3-monooxygenase (FAD)/4-hydroxyphenylacetate 3-monooxygenase
MPIRSGRQFIEGLRDQPRDVWVEGMQVDDVTTHPAFANNVATLAQQYDMQFDPRFSNRLTYREPETGELASTALMPANSVADLQRRGDAYRVQAEASFGVMGRSSHFMLAVVLAFYENRHLFGAAGDRYAENMASYYRYVRDNDLLLSHALITPQNDRSRASSEQADENLHLRVVEENAAGIVVKGARMLATLGPVCDEILMYNLPANLRPGDEDHCLVFAVPANVRGLRQIARLPYAVNGSQFDHPLSSRFEESDSLLIFNDVFVPWERVFSIRDLDMARKLMSESGAYMAHVSQVRALVKLQFSVGLAIALARSIKVDTFLHVQQMLGEGITYIELLKNALYRAEHDAETMPTGVVRCSAAALQSVSRMMPRFYPRIVEIIQTIGAGGLMMMPSGADFTAPEIADDVARHFQGAEGVTATERVRLFKLAWDLVGEAFGSRAVQYERYYTGDPLRIMAQAYAGYQDPVPAELVAAAVALAGDPLPTSTARQLASI